VALVLLSGCGGGEHSTASEPSSVARISVSFPAPASVMAGDEVRVGHTRVGHVVAIQPGASVTRAVLEVDRAILPLSPHAEAILRQKTTGGPIYVQLAGPRGRGSPT
jgi:ABC-type transporter Mla subunit MlaD